MDSDAQELTTKKADTERESDWIGDAPPAQPDAKARTTSVRPPNSRMIPPANERGEWAEISLSAAKKRARDGTISKTAVADQGTLVERSVPTHGLGTYEDSSNNVLPPQSELPPPCKSCGAPRTNNSKYCVACGSPFEDYIATTSLAESIAKPEQVQGTAFHCQSCGSDIVISTSQLVYRCPFCDSNYVAEIQSAATDRRKPEFVIGFAVTREQALERFHEWIQVRGLFRPGDLSMKAMSDKQMGVYIPFWHYAYQAQSQWRSRIGQYWFRTETYTVRNSEGKTETRTRVVQETEWSSLQGFHRRYYFGFLVSASKGLSHNEALTIQPFDLRELTRFQRFFLAGWMSEEYSIDYPQAKAIAEEEFGRREVNNIRSMMPGDTHADLQVQTQFTLNETDLILLPVHVLSYRYRDRVYRFLVNGQTGKFAGEKPLSSLRIGVAIAIAVALIIVVVVLFLVFGS